MLSKPLEIYLSFLNSSVHELQKKQKKYNCISSLRLFLFVAFLSALFYIIFNSLGLALIIITAVFLVALIVLVRISVHLNKKMQFLEKIVLVCTNETDILNGQLNKNANGEELTDGKHPYTLDLDIFGKGSVFHSLNRTCTKQGFQFLSESLMHQNNSNEAILLNQSAISELSQDPEWCLNFLASGLSEQENRRKKSNGINVIVDWIKEDPRISTYTPTIKKILLVVPIINCLVVLLIIILKLPYICIIFPFLWNLIITFKHRKKISHYHKNISNSAHQLKTIGNLCQLLESKPFTSEKLNSIQSHLKNIHAKASAEIKKLETIANAFDNRLNFLVITFLNLVLLWDVRCLYRSDEWKDQNSKNIDPWLNSIGNFDALISIALYNFNNPGFATPKIDKTIILSVKELSHPLINSQKRVSNDFCIKNSNNISIITGANMAGKSTFLRTIGVNLVLAMIGSKVCAHEFIFKPMNLYSGMRNTDSIETGDSYFYAEIKRLQVLVNQLKAGIDHFVLLDEILKGTNSVDKLIGSQLFIKKLLSLKGEISGLIATHDLPLTNMIIEYPENIQNYCFEALVIDKKLHCDYKIKEGITKNMNAILLMEELEIIDPVINYSLFV